MTTLRCARVSDLPQLNAWCTSGQGSSLALEPQTVKLMLMTYPEGQLVSEHGSDVSGVLHSIRVSSLSVLSQCTYETQINHHDSFGPIVLILAINVNAKVGNARKTAELLRNAFLQLHRDDPTVEQVVAVTRCSAFSNHLKSRAVDAASLLKDSNNLSALFEQYVRKGSDPTIMFHTAAGGRIAAVLPNYRSRDTDNSGFGVLVSYDTSNVVTSGAAPPGVTRGTTGCFKLPAVHRLLQQYWTELFGDGVGFVIRLHERLLLDWIGGYSIEGNVWLPVAAMVEIMCAAAARVYGLDRPIAIADLIVTKLIPVESSPNLQASNLTHVYCLVRESGLVGVFTKDSDGNKIEHATGQVVRLEVDLSGPKNSATSMSQDVSSYTDSAVAARGNVGTSHGDSPQQVVLDQIQTRCSSPVDTLSLISRFQSKGVSYSHPFQLMDACGVDIAKAAAWCKLNLGTDHDGVESNRHKAKAGYLLYPPLFDALWQCASACCIDSQSSLAMAHAVEKISVSPTACSKLFDRSDETITMTENGLLVHSKHCHGYVEVTSRSDDGHSFVVNCWLLTSRGEVCMSAKGVHMRVVRTGKLFLRAMGASPSTTELQDDCESAFVALTNCWRPVEVFPSELKALKSNRCLVVVEGTNESMDAKIRQLFSAVYHDVVIATSFNSVTQADTELTTYDDVVVVLQRTVSTMNTIEEWLRMLERLVQISKRVLVVSTEQAGVLPPSEADSENIDLIPGIIGSLASVRVEYPQIQLVSVRLSLPQQSDNDPLWSLLGDALVCELALSDGETEVLYGPGAMRHVLRYSEKTHITVEAEAGLLRDDYGAYIITGGLGGLGLLTAKVLAKDGAHRIVLVSRSGKIAHTGQGLEDDLHWLQYESGCEIILLCCDMSDEHAVVAMLNSVRSLPSLDPSLSSNFSRISGIIHGAGVLRDAVLRGGGAATGSKEVWRCKADSAWYLHKHSMALADKLRLFVCYSSIASATGNAGQASYSAANRYLDSLMVHRQSIDPSCANVSIRWPSVAGVGMAAAAAAGGHMSLEVGSMTQHDAERLLQTLIGEMATNTKAVSVNDPVWTIMPTSLLNVGRAYLENGVYRQFAALDYFADTAESAVELSNKQRRLGTTETKKTTSRKVPTLPEIAHKIGLILSSLIGSASVGRNVELMNAGLDSLGISEFVGQLTLEFGIKLSPNVVFNHPTIDDIALMIFDKLGGITASDSKPPVVATAVLQEGPADDHIAIVGCSVCASGSITDMDSLARVLFDGINTSSLVTANRWDPDYEAALLDLSGPVIERIRYAHFLDDNLTFDASHFNLNSNEAEEMDVNHKLLLQVSRSAFLDANIRLDSLNRSNAGVFVGLCGSVETAGANAAPSVPDPFADKSISVYGATSTSLSVASGRIAFVFGTQGPCMTVDTACSSSLVALHYAKKSLCARECNVALVASSNVISAKGSVACALAGMTSDDGKCHTFDASANGYSRGEGSGALVLKRLSDAMRDGDAIYAVVRGSAVLQDGKSASLTAPNGLAQEQLLRAALTDARVSPDDVCYLEAHGTGTKLGDPIETEALANVFGGRSAAAQPLIVSGVKANVGHLEAAAGMMGLLAAVVALRSKHAPPNGQLKTLNPAVVTTIQGRSVAFPTKPTALLSSHQAINCGNPNSSPRLVAGVSSFGYSGTISHVVLEEAPDGHARPPLSPLAGPVMPMAEGEAAGVIWQFSGQGTLCPGVCQDVYDGEPAFREAMATCDELLRDRGVTVSQLLYPRDDTERIAAESMLADPLYAQPALLVLQYSLSAVWRFHGMHPSGGVIGHSLGEYAAALAAGVLDLSDCLDLVCARGRLMSAEVRCRGVMVAVRANEADVLAAIADCGCAETTAVAAVNGSSSVVLSGSPMTVEAVIVHLGNKSATMCSHRKLDVEYAYHSPLAKCVLDDYRKVLGKVTLRKPMTPFYSTVFPDGDCGPHEPEYWCHHIVKSVRYAEAVTVAYRAGGRVFIELGADQTLTRLSTVILKPVGDAMFSSSA